MYREKAANDIYFCKLKQKRDLPSKVSPQSVYFKMTCFGENEGDYWTYGQCSINVK